MNKHPVFCHAWDMARLDRMYRSGPEHDAYGDGYEDGAAAFAGLMGMAEAVRLHEVRKRNEAYESPVTAMLRAEREEGQRILEGRPMTAFQKLNQLRLLREQGIISEEQYRKLLLMA